jgi:Tol biopolymer transport system component/class 3 adenylate cyclase
MSDLLTGPSRTPGPGSSRTLEIAHVLFTDIVGYSKLPMDEQEQLLTQLQDAVRQTPEFARAEANEELIRLPTGDGMALVFFRDAESPVRCALELSRSLRDHPEIKLRMGIHSGPVYRVADINANRNVAGGGINIAQRVMDCCDAGHILISEEVAKVLGQLSRWKGCLQDLGEAEVKHSVRVHLFNFCTQDVGNSALPQKLRASTALSAADVAKAGRRRTRRRLTVILTAFVLSAVIVLSVFAGLYRTGRRAPARISQAMTITRLTNNGKSRKPSISPDGKYVAYIVEDADRQSLWVRQGATASDIQIISPAETLYSDVLFSRDSSYIYFTRAPRTTMSGSFFDIFLNRATLYRVPTLGGGPREIIKDLRPPVSLSPDGKSLCFGEFLGRGLMLANADGSGTRPFADFQHDTLFLEGFAWSPDGKTIAWSTGRELVTVSLASVLGAQLGQNVSERVQPRALSRRRWSNAGNLTWVSDGSALILDSSDRNAENPSQLWLVTYPQGEVERITNDFNDYHGVSMNSDSTALVTAQQQNLYSTWVVPEHDVSRAHQISVAAGNEGALDGLAWTPDGKLLYTSRTGNHMDIGIMDAEGNDRRYLTADSADNWIPSASPDGGTIVFVSDRTGHQCVWKMAIDAGSPVQMTHGDDDWMPSFSPDGKWIVYVGTASGKYGVWKVPSDGGTPIYVTAVASSFVDGRNSSVAVLSPDARMIASRVLDVDHFDTVGFRHPIWNTKVFAIEGGKLIRAFGTPTDELAWSPDGHSLTYVDTRNGVSNIWSQPLTSDVPEQLTHFTSDRIFSYAWSRDGRQLAVARGTETSDIVEVTNFH